MTKEPLSLNALVDGVRNSDRTVVAQAITLVESTAPQHQELANNLLRTLVPMSGQSLRLGITGVPGAGKSTFIERFGLLLADASKRVAVLTIDPSSPRTGGSILGDKTRMQNLSRHPGCFVRPSPSRGSLGGVARKTREAIVICEAAGFDTIIVETVGVGQSEVAVRSMTDIFVLLCITGAGDELQGFKKGVIELSDVILVNKADGENEVRARQLTAEFNRILRYLPAASEHWRPKAIPISALSGSGLSEAWELIASCAQQLTQSGELQIQRTRQVHEWIDRLISEEIERFVFGDASRTAFRDQLADRVVQGAITAREAVKLFMRHAGLDKGTAEVNDSQ